MSQSHSNSPVAGLNGIDHSDKGTQYKHSIEGGLQTRPEGTRQHEFSSNDAVESLHPATIADIKRGRYNGDQQNGNQHKAAGFGADLVRGSLTRPGQGAKAKDANKLEDCGGY
ncbi:MAG: hypothetical protein LAP86_25840 [Acidobacteriia bacterium]|nr:hypothetical protein [Terriglobia bacterium]